MQTRQGGLKILRKLGVGSTGGDIWASNQYVIISCQAMGRQKQARNRASKNNDSGWLLLFPPLQ